MSILAALFPPLPSDEREMTLDERRRPQLRNAATELLKATKISTLSVQQRTTDDNTLELCHMCGLE
eukprot:898823-Prymnesium_polylepis.1